MTAAPPLHVACPRCEKAVVWSPANPWRPFCSERCKLTDLGAWASEAYRVPAGDHDRDGGRGPEETRQ